MQRNNLTLVVFFSFLGVVLAQEKSNEIQVIIDDEQEEHPGSVYIKPIGINHSIFIEKPQMENNSLSVYFMEVCKVPQKFPYSNPLLNPILIPFK